MSSSSCCLWEFVFTFWCGFETLLLTVCPEGMCKVLGPALPMKRFWSLMLANVPLVITASLPLRAPYELNSRGVRLRGHMDKWLSIPTDSSSSTLLPDLKRTVCSAGTWLRRWPWQCCQLVRCDLLSRCFRGTVRRERSLSTGGLEPLCSETHRNARVSERNPTSCSKGRSEETHQLAEERRRAYIRGLVIPGENHRIWTLDAAPEHVPFLGQTTQRRMAIPVKAGGGETRRRTGGRCSHLYPSSEILENGGDDSVFFGLLDLLPGRPDVPEIHLLPFRRDTYNTHTTDNHESNLHK